MTQSKRTIYIDRPDGMIPGLIEINSYLAEHFGVVVAAVIDTDDKERFRWVGTKLSTATIVNDSIVLGAVIARGGVTADAASNNEPSVD